MFFPEKKVSPDFPSQAKLARFMQILPQTLHKAIQEERNGFRFRGKSVKVVQQKIPHWGLFDLSSSETPIETFETVSDVAKWLQVTKQAVYTAINRGLEPHIKNKKGTVFWLQKLQESEEEPPIQKEAEKTEKVVSLSQEKVPPGPFGPGTEGPVPAPRAKVEKEKLPPGPEPGAEGADPLSPEKVSPVPPGPFGPGTEGPVPAPRKKKIPPVPLPRKAKTEEKSLLEQKERAEEEVKCYLTMINYQMEREEEERDNRRQENYNALRVKYCKWFLDDDVDIETEKTKIVIFNPDTGVNIPVKKYEDIANYFNSRGYLCFLEKSRFDETLSQGRMTFIASTKDYATEEWIRFIFIRDPIYE